jgi:para-aminobenzoate synthetase/4-amino-4-deoxychorismate lyase
MPARDAAGAPLGLIETMRFEPGYGVLRLDRHLDRLGRSAAAFGIGFARAKVCADIEDKTRESVHPARVRLLLPPVGRPVIALQPMPAMPDGTVDVTAVPLPVPPGDIRLRHKTTDRGFYDHARGAHFEVVFLRPDGLVTEGSFTNLFVARGGMLLTPPLAVGLLPGVLRADLLDQGLAIETPLRLADLRDGFLIGNALRGLMPARLAGR